MNEQTQFIFGLVQRTGRLLRLSWVTTGLGTTVGLLFGSLVAVSGIDLLVPLAPPLRLLGLLMILGLTIGAYLLTVVRPVSHPLALVQVARRMERHLPRIHNRLVSCIDLMSNGNSARYSAAFCRRLVAETHDRVHNFQPLTVVDRPRARRAVVFGAATVAVFAAALWLMPERLPTAMARVFLPLADIPPTSAVSYSISPGDAKLLRGDNLTFTVQIERGNPGKLGVEIAADGGGRTLWYELQKQKGRTWKFTLEGFEHSFRYRIVGGDTWSKRYRVVLLERPTLVELHTVMRYPAYLGIPEPLVGKSQTADVTGPEGSEVDVVCEVKGTVARGAIQRLSTAAQPGATNNVDDDAQVAVAGSLPMRKQADGKWVGTFHLTSNGFYRVEFRNEAGYANKTMRRARYVATPDHPPQITLERPGTDLVLSEGGKVPLVIAAYDDLGLAEVNLAVKRSTTNEFTAVPVKQYPAPLQSDALVTTLDLSAMNLKVGEYIHYRAEAKDRKGQAAQTREFLVRIAVDDRASDRQLSRFTEVQDQFAKRLADLIATQDVVRAALSGVAVQYAPLIEKIDAAKIEIRPGPDREPGKAEGTATNAVPNLPLLKLDPVEANLLEGMRKKLGDLAVAEDKNTEMARAFSADWVKATATAGNLAMFPVQMTDQMRLMQQAFDQMAVTPMLGLASALKQNASTNQLPGDVEAMHQTSDRLQQDLESIQARLANVNTATDQIREDPNQAVNQLENEMLTTRATMAARDLQGLQAMLDDMLAEMKRLQGDEENLLTATGRAPEGELPVLAKEQAAVEQKTDPLLDFTQQLQATDKLRRLKREPKFPAAPYLPDQDKYNVPPAEDDTDEPAATNAVGNAGSDKGRNGEDKKKEEEEEEPLYLPALGGPQPKLDPRFAEKYRPAAKTARTGGSEPAKEQREELRAREWQRAKELNLAQQSTSADQRALESMVNQLEHAIREAQAGRSRDSQAAGRSRDSQAAPRSLSEMMQDQSLQQAMMMGAMMQQMVATTGGANPGARRHPWLRGLRAFGGGGLVLGQLPGEGKLPELDVNARSVILGMQPQLREELLQGMREEGPEPYRKFIENYYKQLTKVKSPQ